MAELSRSSAAAPSAQRRGDAADDALAPVRAWIEQNDTLAVLAGFAAGVFLGALLRR